jgi:RPA family protein
MSADDALSRIRAGDLVVFSGCYDPDKKQFIISKLANWLP